MKQRQAVLTVRVVIEKDTNKEDAELLVAEALEQAELMAHVRCDKIETVKA